VISGVGLAFDVRQILENSTTVGAAKIIVGRFVKSWTSPKLLIAGKCVMLVGGIVASISTGGNPLIISTTVSAACSIVKDL
jgi:hypothetical protein